MPDHLTINQAATAAAAADLGYSTRQAGALAGVSSNSVRNIIRGHGRWGEIAERPVFVRLRSEQQRILEATSRSLAAQALVQTEVALPKASALQAATVFAIMVDKSRLLAGESTANVEVHVKTELVGMDQLCQALTRALVPDVSRDSNVRVENRTDEESGT